jgi:isochorismate pyruvate lyase
MSDMVDATSLDEIRAAIDAVDADLVRLLARRESLVRQAAPLKRDARAVQAPGRVEQVVARARAQATAAGGDPDVVERIYRAMIQAFIDMELTEHHRVTGRPSDKGVIE